MFPGGSPIVRPSTLATRLRFSPGAPCTAATGVDGAGSHGTVYSSPQVLPLLQRRGHRVVSWYPPPPAPEASVRSGILQRCPATAPFCAPTCCCYHCL
jgi:hypothetical protein